MRCARGKSVQVRRARAERVEVCVLEGRAQQQQRARVAAHHTQLAALAALAVTAATAYFATTALVADAHAVACLCDARAASRGVGAAALMRGGRGLLILLLQAGAQPPHAQPVERGVARSQLAAARLDVRGGHLARMAHEARYRVQAGGEARCTGEEQPFCTSRQRWCTVRHARYTHCTRTAYAPRGDECAWAPPRAQSAPAGAVEVPMARLARAIPGSWRGHTARHGLPPKACGLRDP